MGGSSSRNTQSTTNQVDARTTETVTNNIDNRVDESDNSTAVDISDAYNTDNSVDQEFDIEQNTEVDGNNNTTIRAGRDVVSTVTNTMTDFGAVDSAMDLSETAVEEIGETSRFTVAGAFESVLQSLDLIGDTSDTYSAVAMDASENASDTVNRTVAALESVKKAEVQDENARTGQFLIIGVAVAIVGVAFAFTMRGR